jgi:hypothetical protein
MTRLADRMLLGVEPFHLPEIVKADEMTGYLRNKILKKSLAPLDETELMHRVEIERERLLNLTMETSQKFDSSLWNRIPIFVADEVARYFFLLTPPIDYYDVVSSMAPPFDKFFVEFQNVSKITDVYAWGCLITSIDQPDKIKYFDGDEGKARWVLDIKTFLQFYKHGVILGPVAEHSVGLAEDGTWFRHGSGEFYWRGGLFGQQHKDVVELSQHFKWATRYMGGLIIPALLSISFMHCKNVETETITPPEKLSKKYRKRHGHDLIRYHVLDIKPIRRLLERHQTGASDDLRRALHICRGHFKTFTPDAPLWGRHVGTYWWAPQVRGSESAGIVLKDYRVNAPSEFGKGYREANENPPDADKEAPPLKDPDSAGRGLAAHNRTQNQIANIVRELGWTPRSPGVNEPDYDIAWKVKDGFFVCEVKSLTPASEERQLRIGLGQVIRYRQKLNAAAYEPVRALIATEIAPHDQSWNELCEKENIILIWPEIAETKLKVAMEQT